MAKSFNPGSFRHKIDFLKPPEKKDACGELLPDWLLFKKAVYAAVEPILGKELYAALTADTRVEVKFKLRYFPGVTNDMRIRHGTDVYEIISAINVNTAHKELLCYCRLMRP